VTELTSFYRRKFYEKIGKQISSRVSPPSPPHHEIKKPATREINKPQKRAQDPVSFSDDQ
jgi:hypothetical protein